MQKLMRTYRLLVYNPSPLARPPGIFHHSCLLPTREALRAVSSVLWLAGIGPYRMRGRPKEHAHYLKAGESIGQKSKQGNRVG
jgi:hypothetical protein